MGVLYKEVKHIIDQQYEAESKFLEEYGKESHTIANPYVVLNPYLIAPLTALVMFENEKPAFAKVTVKGKEAAGDYMYRQNQTQERWFFRYTACTRTMIIP